MRAGAAGPLHTGQIQCERRFCVKGHFAACRAFGIPAMLVRSLDAFPPLFLSAVKVFEFLLADPNVILAVVCMDRITNKSNTNKKTKKQIELLVIFNSFEVDVITAERLRR